jgi:hypothetical protein
MQWDNTVLAYDISLTLIVPHKIDITNTTFKNNAGDGVGGKGGGGGRGEK